VYHAPTPIFDVLPAAPARRWARRLRRFLEIESAGGVVLLLCTALALALANSRYAAAYAALWQTRVNLTVGDWHLFHAPHDTLLYLINDALMTIFFFVVGLEIKREVVAGELNDRRKAALPVIAALGGMVVPAVVYLTERYGRAGERGWGIPMATDIAFVVGVLALFGRRAPLGLKIFLLSLAIADDIGAVLVIAVAYTGDLNFGVLGLGALGFLVTLTLNRIGVRQVPVYVVVGAGIWYCFLVAGVHPTVAGVLLGLLTPASAWVGDASLLEALAELVRRWREGGPADGRDRHAELSRLAAAAREAVSPLERLETALHPWVRFGIMPLFALANAGVALDPRAAVEPVAIAVATGLLLGKPVGITLFSWAAVRLGLARLPGGVSWPVMVGAGCLGGIGFTMSLFIAALALPAEDLLAAGKLGTLAGSTASAALGSAVLLFTLPRAAAVTPTATGR
jgi:NhaA family Na+:H+ antiporter